MQSCRHLYFPFVEVDLQGHIDRSRGGRSMTVILLNCSCGHYDRLTAEIAYQMCTGPNSVIAIFFANYHTPV